MVEKGCAEYAIALTIDALRYTGRSEIRLMTDQENAVGVVANLVAEQRRPMETQMMRCWSGARVLRRGCDLSDAAEMSVRY